MGESLIYYPFPIPVNIKRCRQKVEKLNGNLGSRIKPKVLNPLNIKEIWSKLKTSEKKLSVLLTFLFQEIQESYYCVLHCLFLIISDMAGLICLQFLYGLVSVISLKESQRERLFNRSRFKWRWKKIPKNIFSQQNILPPTKM